MRCLACNKILSDKEATRRYRKSDGSTGDFVDLCDKDFKAIEDQISVVEQKEGKPKKAPIPKKKVDITITQAHKLGFMIRGYLARMSKQEDPPRMLSIKNVRKNLNVKIPSNSHVWRDATTFADAHLVGYTKQGRSYILCEGVKVGQSENPHQQD
jgi:hypothetical protein